MKFISLFAGIGGFDLALTRLGHTCVYANEWDKYATEIYHRRFLSDPDQGIQNDSSNTEIGSVGFKGLDTRDIRTVPTTEIPDHDLLVGGFPCQAFSIAGKRKGFDDTRGTLFFEIARILREKHPRLFILENVKGLLSHDNGNTFKTIVSTFDELGYDLQWQVLNSKNFGVPQNRERVFIIGNLRGEPRPQIFPVRENGELSIEGDKRTPAQIAPVLKATNQYMKSDDQYIGTTLYDISYPSRIRKYTEFSPTVKNFGSGGNKMPMVNAIRRLTPVECERLQGFPDNWTEGVSDTQRYKCLGNAVTVNVVEYIVKNLF